jgi:hypothetical protein
VCEDSLASTDFPKPLFLTFSMRTVPSLDRGLFTLSDSVQNYPPRYGFVIRFVAVQRQSLIDARPLSAAEGH